MVHCNRRRRGRIHILTTNYSAGKRSSPRAAGEAIKRRDEGEETRAKIARRYECFCLHARNLINFFWEDKPPNAKDAVARHFTDASYNPFGGICPQEKTRGLYGKLNKQITHITYDRTNDEVEKLGSDDRESLYNRIEEEIENFGKHIREPYTEFRDIYRKSAKLEVEKTVRTSQSRTTTSTTEVYVIRNVTGPTKTDNPDI